jgi:hypothetical protein
VHAELDLCAFEAMASIFAMLCATSYTRLIPMSSTLRWKTCSSERRTQYTMYWRFAQAKFAAAAIAAR